MKILITGNSGYIGSHLSKMLDSKYELWGLDLNNPQHQLVRHRKHDIRQALPENKNTFDAVIHLAALVSVGESATKPTDYYMTNFIGTLNVLKTIKCKNFIFASTGAAEKCESAYGTSKRAAEDCVKEWCEFLKLPYTIFRFYNVIGSDGFKPTNPDGLMYNLMNAQKTGEFNLYGNDYNTKDGSAVRDYVHVNEICNAINQSILEPTNQIENLGHGVGTTVKEMVDIYKRVNDCDFKINICPRRPGDIERSVLDNPSKFMQKLYNMEELLKV